MTKIGRVVAVPDFTLKPERILADGDHATVQWRIRVARHGLSCAQTDGR